MSKRNTTVEIKGLSVDVRDGHFERALRLFSKKVQEAGILREVRDRQEYEKPSVKNKRSRAMARKRHLKELEKNQKSPNYLGGRKK